MPAVIPIALKAEMGADLSKLATLMKITRTDGFIYGFTTHDAEITYGGITYYPTSSFTPTDVASGADMQADNLTIGGSLTADTITEDDLRAGRWDYAEFRIFQVNWSNLGQGEAKVRKGKFGDVSVTRIGYQVELLGLLDAYAVSIGLVTQPLCRTSLGEPDCQVPLTGSPASRTVTGTIGTADTDFMTLHDPARTEPDTIFDEGRITIHFASGDLSYEVKAYIVGTWITKTGIAYDATGVTYTMTEGCDRQFRTCVDRFANGVNFQGEPHLRGNDALVQVGRHT